MQVVCRSDVELLGNIVNKEFTLRYFSDGTAITQLEVIVKKKTKASNKEHVEVFQLCARAEQAERIKRYAKTGDGVVIKAQLRTQKDPAGKILSALEIDHINFVGYPSQLYWNRISLVGEIVAKSYLRKSVNNQDYIKLQLLTDAKDPVHKVNCNLWAYPAQLIDKDAQLGDKLAVEGSLKKAFAEDQQVSPILVDGHTCLRIES